MSKANDRERIAKSAKELAHSDVGTEPWAKSVKTSVLSASKSDIGLFVVATALLQAARDERLAELSRQYQDATKALKAKEFGKAQKVFESLGDYSDAKHKAELAAAKERDRIARDTEIKKRNETNYKKAIILERQKKYDQAIAAFASLGLYKDSQKRANNLRGNEKRYKAAKSKLDNGKYADAKREFDWLGDYRDARKLSKEADRILTRDKRKKRAAEIKEELGTLRAEERTLSEKANRIEEAKRAIDLPESKEPGCLFYISCPIAIMWIIYSIYLIYSLTNHVQLSSDHIPLFIVSTIVGPTITILMLVQESIQSNKRKEAEQFLKTIKSNDNTQTKLSSVRGRIEKCEIELRTLGKDVL